MTDLADALAELGDALAQVTAAAGEGLRSASDADVLEALAQAGRVRRLAEAVVVEAVAAIVGCDERAPHADRVTTRYGCRNLGELLQRATRVSGRTAGDVVAAAKAVRRQVAPSTGETLPPEFPSMRGVLLTGDAGLDGVVAVASVFRGCLVGRESLLAADTELAAAVRGDAVGPVSADELRAMAQVWAVFLDPDGAEPVEARAMRRRGFTIGRRGADGLVPVRGGLLPEVAAQLQLGLDSVLNPKVDGAGMPGPRFDEAGSSADAVDGPFEGAADTRTATQKRHHALATLLAAAVSSGELPMLGGAAPTLVVQVREEDLTSGRGYAHLPGAGEPVSIGVARQVACTGAVQRVVLSEGGRIVSLTTFDRIFTHHQRRAITLRDGGCLIPGCDVPPQWCEIHHVQEHSGGGPTHTDNGVLLCWFHHRTIDTGGWQIRMIDGVPHVRGPSWWDAEARWRPATGSPVRRRDQIALRI
ncbi:HNH endonuclease signature motif containing protein [Microbacterium jejuense]|uniref:HNH endonuclease signature motif containing protein n=1 Tax=Microbacterium jejuense TaxID=1263637 RepID=UPI0031ED63BC